MGVIQQLIQTVVARRIEGRDDVKQLKQEFADKVQKVYNAGNLTELPDLAKGISELLGGYAPGAELNMRFEDPKVPELRLPNVISTLIEDGFGGGIGNKGHGLQRALIICLLHYMQAMAPKSAEPTGAEGEAAEAPEIILAIEEPELYLHPSRCRYLANLLQQLASDPKQRMQVLYVTQSPFFVSLRRFEQVRMVRKIDAPDTKTKQSRFSQFTPAAGAKRQAEINNDGDKKKYTADSFTARAMPVMNTTINEGFFAEAILIGEGPTEVGIFTELAEIMFKKKQIPRQWEEAGVVVVPAGGKPNIDRPTIIFQGLDIPTFILWDGDGSEANQKKKADDTHSSRQANQRLQRLAGIQTPTDWPATHVADGFSVLTVDVEQVCKEALTMPTYLTIRDEAANEVGYDGEKTNALKSVECAAAFIRLAYDKYAKSIPLLEDIVKRVTAKVSTSSMPAAKAVG